MCHYNSSYDSIDGRAGLRVEFIAAVVASVEEKGDAMQAACHARHATFEAWDMYTNGDDEMRWGARLRGGHQV